MNVTYLCGTSGLCESDAATTSAARLSGMSVFLGGRSHGKPLNSCQPSVFPHRAQWKSFREISNHNSWWGQADNKISPRMVETNCDHVSHSQGSLSICTSQITRDDVPRKSRNPSKYSIVIHPIFFQSAFELLAFDPGEDSPYSKHLHRDG